MVNWRDATTHVFNTHFALRHGRPLKACAHTKQTKARRFFRLQDHTDRLFPQRAYFANEKCRFDKATISEAQRAAVREKQFRVSLYSPRWRFYGAEAMGIAAKKHLARM